MKKYFLYARKSSEDKDRQIQSIPDQISVMSKKAQSLGIQIIQIFKEERSAKSPGRSEFNKMIKAIRAGEANGIISWKLDRLSRNPVDSGTLQYMLQTGELEIIVTNDRSYSDTDAGLLFSVESGIGNQFILDLKKAVRRGMDYKVNTGVFSAMAPLGYLNKKDDKTIIVDEERFDMVRKMWDMMLSGNYTVRQIMNIANDDWGFKRRDTKKVPGGPLRDSGLYRMFNSIFYTGDFLWKGQIMKGTHRPMITYEEFYRVQEMLGAKGIHYAGQTKEFAYTGFIKCAECGSAITATEKKKEIKNMDSKGKVGKIMNKSYIYYHCTKRKIGSENCSQKPIRLEDLEKQIDDILCSVQISPEFKEWGLKILKDDFENDFKIKQAINRNLQSSLDESEKKLKNLTEALIGELIDKEEFLITKKQIQIDIEIWREKIKRLNDEKDSSYDDTERVFDFIVNARTGFNHGSLQTKKEIFRALGLNWRLEHGKLHGEAFPWLQPIQGFNSKNRLKNPPLELIKNSTSMLSIGAENEDFIYGTLP